MRCSDARGDPRPLGHQCHRLGPAVPRLHARSGAALGAGRAVPGSHRLNRRGTAHGRAAQAPRSPACPCAGWSSSPDQRSPMRTPCTAGSPRPWPTPLPSHRSQPSAPGKPSRRHTCRGCSPGSGVRFRAGLRSRGHLAVTDKSTCPLAAGYLATATRLLTLAGTPAVAYEVVAGLRCRHARYQRPWAEFDRAGL